MILKTEAIVLKTFDLRETSRIAVFFTENYGKVKGVLKGIRADHKKFGSNLDKFSAGQVWDHYREYSEMLRKKDGWVAYNCYRCSNMTNPSTPIGDLLGSFVRMFYRYQNKNI